MTIEKLPIEKRVPFWDSLPAEYQADVIHLDNVANPVAWFVGAPQLTDGVLKVIEYLAVTANEYDDDETSTVISLLIDFEEAAISTRELVNGQWNTGYDA